MPLELAAANHAATLAALVNVDTPMKQPNRFVAMHACDGLALQQNVETATLVFNTVSLDEKPSEFLAPLVQLHGDKAMDRICEGSGRGLTFHLFAPHSSHCMVKTCLVTRVESVGASVEAGVSHRAAQLTRVAGCPGRLGRQAKCRGRVRPGPWA